MSSIQDNARILADYLENHFDLASIELPKEYNYTCFPLCLLDAVFSIGANYQSTMNVVKRYCDQYTLTPFGKRDSVNHTTVDLIKNICCSGSEVFATDIVKNCQRTSSVNGILKAEAVLQCADVFRKHQINTIFDFNSKLNEQIENEFRKVKGQSSGISLSYLKMLCGDENTLKADRHVRNFLYEVLSCSFSVEEAQAVVQSCVEQLRKKTTDGYAEINVRKIDYLIWEYMSKRPLSEQSTKPCCR